jgi:hypothetical protein
MSVSRHDLRTFAGLALVICAALLGVECGDYFLRDIQDIDAIGHRPALVSEFGSGVPVVQSFLVPRDGLHAMTVSVASDQAAVIAFQFSLIRKGVLADWPDEPIIKRQIQMSVLAGVTRKTIDFPAVSRSKDRVFVATFTLSDVRRRGSTASDPHVALAAWSDDAFSGGSLKVGAEDRWGDLAFSAQVEPATRLPRLITALNRALAPTLQLGKATVVALTALYAVLVAIVCYWGLRLRRGADSGTALAPEMADTQHEEPRSVQSMIRVAGTVTFAVMTPLLFTTILVTRERVAVDLLDRLDAARMESPSPMHTTFSRIEEVINGQSPNALFAQPPSRITWTVDVPVQKPWFKTSVALRPYVWEHRSDGAAFDVIVTDGTHQSRATRFLNPATEINDRAWVEMNLDLAEYAGRTVQVSLETSPGPHGDPGWDWAMWGNPRIVSLRWFDRYPRASRDLNRERSGD